MKKLSKIFIVLVLLSLSGMMNPQQSPAQGVAVSFQLFYDELSPYGQWVEYPGYNYVWIPDAGPDFSPYATSGHWVLTSYGWTWVSDYPWGWAPFHYGRWFYDDYYGWMWVPGREWGPAWVQWRRCEGYYGWAPISPGVGIEVTFGNGYRVHRDHWRFVHDRDFDRPDIDRCYVDRRENSRFIQRSTVIDNRIMDERRHVAYVAGPDRGEVRKYTGREVREVAIQENNRPGQDFRDNKLMIYKPTVQKTRGNNPAPVPSRAVPIKEAKPWSQRNTNNQQQGVNPVENNAGRQMPTQGRNDNPPRKYEKGQQQGQVRPNDNNMGRSQPMQQNNDNPRFRKQEEQPHPANPPGRNFEKAQPVPQHNANPGSTPRKEGRPQGNDPMNAKKAVQEKKGENPPRK